jgi:hypothetical protein
MYICGAMTAMRSILAFELPQKTERLLAPAGFEFPFVVCSGDHPRLPLSAPAEQT